MKRSQIRLKDVPSVAALCALRERVLRAAGRAASQTEVAPGVALALRAIKGELAKMGLRI